MFNLPCFIYQHCQKHNGRKRGGGGSAVKNAPWPGELQISCVKQEEREQKVQTAERQTELEIDIKPGGQ